MDASRIILGVIGADCHSVGNKILDAYFTEAGFHVVNLGVMVSQDEFLDAAVESDAAAILVSSLYGHGLIDCEGLRQKAVERGLDKILLYVGGNLVVGKTPYEETEKKFKDMGFDRVFSPQIDLADVVKMLHGDIEARKG